MGNLAWTQNLESGDEGIDAENERLLLVLNDLFASGRPCPGQAETCQKIEQTVRLLSRRFGREEAAMRATGYPDRRTHKGEHRALLCELQSMKRMYECGRYDGAVVFERLATWAVDHIHTWDKPLGRHLRGVNEYRSQQQRSFATG